MARSHTRNLPVYGSQSVLLAKAMSKAIMFGFASSVVDVDVDAILAEVASVIMDIVFQRLRHSSVAALPK